MPAKVKIANGQLLQCTSSIPACQFSLGQHQFQHDLRILPLDSYDLILGMDWLELFSLMQVHWKAKWISMPYNGDNIMLQDISADSDTDLVIQLLSVNTDSAASVPEPLPP